MALSFDIIGMQEREGILSLVFWRRAKEGIIRDGYLMAIAK